MSKAKNEEYKSFFDSVFALNDGKHKYHYNTKTIKIVRLCL